MDINPLVHPEKKTFIEMYFTLHPLAKKRLIKQRRALLKNKEWSKETLRALLINEIWDLYAGEWWFLDSEVTLEQHLRN